MKYLTPFAIFILFILTIISYIKIKTTSNKLEEYKILNIVLQNDSENYLSSLMNHSKSETFKNIQPVYPEKKKEFEKLADSLKETDNPVLVLVRLKSN
ncbi:MAG TPA: hypothetical protein P5180_12950 [Bacteroidales bacterium]|jgi:hypothetical protein|nr:hypothetical protein [Bacteroidales bacterium]HRW86331.1 hypothetical protein [Bacteroidales bacterium]